MTELVMRMVKLGNAPIKTSRLGLGTSRLHYLGRRERQSILAAAFELGIVHFDTAPPYGDGLAETELGHFLHGRREQVVIATKYGLPIDPVLAQMPSLSWSLRAARSLARKIGYWQQQMPLLTVSGLRSSVEGSLRRLRTDRIDLLLLHEPSVDRMRAADSLLAELNGLRARGLIRAFGLAGKWKGLRSVIEEWPDTGQILQTAENEWEPSRPPDVAYGAISGGAQSFWSGASQEGACERVARALNRRRDKVLLVSTTKVEHLRELAEVESRER